jgi:hypothetical protein
MKNLMQPVQHRTPYTRPGVAFRIHPSRMDRFAGALGTVLNKTVRPKSDVFQELLRHHDRDDAIDSAFLWLSDAFPGFYFGFIGPDHEGWLQYGWIPDGQPQHGSE